MSAEAACTPIARESVLGELRAVGSWFALVLVPLGLAFATSYQLYLHGVLGFDLDGTILEPARAAAHGDSPYPAATLAGVDVGNPSLYPPLVFLLGQPLAALPHAAAVAVWIALLVMAPSAALALLGVRDLRAYAAVTFSFPLVVGAVFGNLTLLLVIPLALAWRRRDDAKLAGASLGVLIALKLFLWPLLVWLLVTRRLRAAGWAILSAILLVIAPWAMFGFRGLTSYPHLLDMATQVFARHSLSLYGAAAGAGLAAGTANAIVFATGGTLLAASRRTARGRGGDARAFVYAVLASLVLSPIVWAHYLVLLAPCVAILQPKFGRLWLIFPASWVGYIVVPGPAHGPCCGAPPGVPQIVWRGLHGSTPFWQIGCTAALLVVMLHASHSRTTRAIRTFGP